jgi:hypothetical protein
MEYTTCPTCTLLNNSTNTNCDICDSTLRPEESAEEPSPLEDEFIQITGSTRSEAQEYLKTTNNNMEVSISYYFSDKDMGISNSDYINSQNIVNSFLQLLVVSTTIRYQKPSNIQELTCQLLYGRGRNKPHYCEFCDSNAYLTSIKIISIKDSILDIIRLIHQEDINELKITEDKYSEIVKEIMTHLENNFIPIIIKNMEKYIKDAYCNREKLLEDTSLDEIEEIMDNRNGPNFRIIWNTLHQTSTKIEDDKLNKELKNLMVSEEFHSYLNQSWDTPVYNHPASKKVISSLKTIKLTKGCEEFKSLKDDKCAVCMNEFVEDEREVVMLDCHSFCKECIIPWLEKHNDTCPVCRKIVGNPCEEQYHKKQKAENQDV